MRRGHAAGRRTGRYARRQHGRVNSVSASRAPAVSARPGEHTATTRRDGSWRWLGRRGSLARRLLLSYGVVVLVDAAVFVSTGLYMTPTRLHGTPRDSAYQDAVFANQLEAVVIAALISLVVGAVTAALLPRLLLDPLRQLRRSTRSLMEGRYTDSVPEPRLPELSDLAQDVNVLAARLADLEVRRARLVSDVAHELRTPLTIIDGQLGGVEDGVYSLDSDLIVSMREELDRLHRLTEDLSGLSRAEESAYELHRARTDLAALSEDATSRLRPQFTHAGIELRHCTSGQAYADVDPHRITQILANLLRNALAATPPGGTVTVTSGGVGRGTTMTLALPAEPDPGPAGPDAEQRTRALGSDPRQPKMPARSAMLPAPGAGQVGAGPAR